jgi:hypothetical protein
VTAYHPCRNGDCSIAKNGGKSGMRQVLKQVGASIISNAMTSAPMTPVSGTWHPQPRRRGGMSCCLVENPLKECCREVRNAESHHVGAS